MEICDSGMSPIWHLKMWCLILSKIELFSKFTDDLVSMITLTGMSVIWRINWINEFLISVTEIRWLRFLHFSDLTDVSVPWRLLRFSKATFSKMTCFRTCTTYYSTCRTCFSSFFVRIWTTAIKAVVFIVLCPVVCIFYRVQRYLTGRCCMMWLFWLFPLLFAIGAIGAICHRLLWNLAITF